MHVIEMVALLAGIPQNSVLVAVCHGDTNVFLIFNIEVKVLTQYQG